MAFVPLPLPHTPPPHTPPPHTHSTVHTPTTHTSPQSTTLTTNDIVINKLTQILSYLRQGARASGRKGRKRDKGWPGLPSRTPEVTSSNLRHLNFLGEHSLLLPHLQLIVTPLLNKVLSYINPCLVRCRNRSGLNFQPLDMWAKKYYVHDFCTGKYRALTSNY